MIDQELLIYIKTKLDGGVSHEQIVSDLLSVGWEKRDIKNAIKMLETGMPINELVKKIARKDLTEKTIFTIIYIITFLVFLMIAVVYVSGMNSHNNRPVHAPIKANMSGIRAQAELAYDNAGYNYNSVCGANNIEQNNTIRTMIEAIDERNGDCEVVCGRPAFGDADAYAISTQFREDREEYWCIDSTGFAGDITAQIGHNDTKCPDEFNDN